MRYRILGPLSVTVDGRDEITASRDRIVLAMLLLHAHRVVSSSELADAVWGDEPPSTARGQLQTCVSRLRRVLPPGAIHTGAAGYRIVVDPEDLDALVLDRLVAEARGTADPQSARRAYRSALDLVRGPALPEMDSAVVRQAAAVLDERGAAAVEDWADLELATGHAREIVGVLLEAVERHPLRERLRGQLMTALHRAGRQADALAEYRRTRDVLRDELGIDPGRELQDLHAAMLAGSLPAAGTAVATGSPVRCLPRTVGDFTGRHETVRRLVGAIRSAAGTGPLIAVIDGMAGSGKTTLALHVAALLGERYPDAHLFVDLLGHSTEQPLDPASALLVLLRQLGVDAADIPAGLVDRVGLWRTELARRRALVLFDNAASSAQLADLLPTAPGSLALITGRRRLAGLDGVHLESLPVLTRGEAVELLRRIVGDRVHAEPAATAEVVRRCGGLPLALRLAGARLAHRPRWRVADLVRRLGESALPELAAEDRSVASAFAVSYHQLPSTAQLVFRLLGVLPATDFDTVAVAALTGLSCAAAQDALDDLVDVHLLEEPEPEAYRLHDLLREFAAALAAELATADRTRALRGFLDQQLHAAAATNLPAYREVLLRDLGDPVPLRPDLVAALADPAARLERERPALAGYVDAAAAVPELAHYGWQLARASWRYLFKRGYVDDVHALLERARVVVERGGDRSATATILNYLASVHYRRSDMDTAARLTEQCIAIRRQLGQWDAAARAMVNLAAVHYEASRWTKSIEVALAARRLSPVRHGRDELNVLAHSYQCLGRYPEALRHHRLRLMMHLEIGDPARLGDTLLNIAVVKYRMGAVGIDAACRQVRTALRLVQRADYPYGEAAALHELALLLAARGLIAEAVAHHRRAVEMAQRMHDRSQESRFRHGYGTTLRLAGDEVAARVMFTEALRLARESGPPYPIALAQAGLGECLLAGDPARARRLLSEARATLAALSAPELRAVDILLAASDGPPAEFSGADHLRAGATGGTMRG